MLYRIGYMCLIAIVLVQTPSGSAWASESKQKLNVVIDGDFDPAAAFRAAKMDPEKVRIVYEIPASDEEMYLDFFLFEGDKKVGFLGMSPDGESNWATYSELESDYRGRRVGSLMYLVGAAFMFEKIENVEALVSYDGSPAANHMWDGLVKAGHASSRPLDPSVDDPRKFYSLRREHITPKLKSFVESLPRN